MAEAPDAKVMCFRGVGDVAEQLYMEEHKVLVSGKAKLNGFVEAPDVEIDDDYRNNHTAAEQATWCQAVTTDFKIAKQFAGAGAGTNPRAKVYAFGIKQSVLDEDPKGGQGSESEYVMKGGIELTDLHWAWAHEVKAAQNPRQVPWRPVK